MGANSFLVTSTGSNATQAFKAAVEAAKHQHGHGGYTGTIAEKHDFVILDVPKGEDPREFANNLLGECDRRIDDKWGPAGCVRTGESTFLFFGYASS